MSDSSSILVPYLFNDRSVRVFTYQNEIWFVARDVGKALGMGNIRELMRNVLDVSEYVYVSKVYDKERRAWIALVRNPDKLKGRCTNLAAINESGLYTLIMRSSKPEALKFRQWVTGEVLPSLRRTGSYKMLKTQNHPEIEEELMVKGKSPKVTVEMKITGDLSEIAHIFANFAGYAMR